MQEVLNSKAYDVSYDKLIADAKHPLDVKNVTVSAGEGIKRGTVLSFVEASGKYGVFGSDSVSAGKANCIVANDVPASSEDVTVTVYVSGSFRAESLIVAKTATLDSKAVEDLRTKGIFIQ